MDFLCTELTPKKSEVHSEKGMGSGWGGRQKMLLRRGGEGLDGQAEAFAWL